MKYQALMIDLETLGTGPRSAVIQMGACAFNYDNSSEAQLFVENINPVISEQFTAEWDTIKWWMQQSDKARDSVTMLTTLTITEVIEQFNGFWEKYCNSSTEVWANPANFDVVILANMFDICEMKPPWKYNKVRCCKSVEIFAPDAERPQPTLKHNAGSDALAQAGWVINMMKGQIRD